MARRSNRLPSVFALDLRGLAAMRIGLGLLVVADVINRARSLSAHYTDFGVLPRDVLRAELDEPWRFSLHLLTGNELLIAGLFVIAAVFGIMLAVGYRTRLATVASWVLLISLQSRNGWLLQGGDELFRALLLWSMFLPLGARYSVDRIRLGQAANRDRPTTVRSLATICFVLQICILYGFSSLSKMNTPVWWIDGLGVHYALGVEQFTTRFGLLLARSAGLVVALNYLTLVAQAIVPIALLIPRRRDLIRTAVPIALIGLHVGLALSMEIGLFSYIAITAWIALLPPTLWDRIERKLAGGRLARPGRALASRLEPAADAEPARVPAPESHASSSPARVFLGATLIYITWWNLAVANPRVFAMPESVESVGFAMRLEQRWRMFSNPPRWTQWYVVAGVLDDGTEIDIFRDTGPVTLEKPELVSATYDTQRWRKYMNNLNGSAGKIHRDLFIAYLCRRWKRDHPDRALARIDFHMMRQATPRRPGRPRNPADRLVLARYDC